VYSSDGDENKACKNQTLHEQQEEDDQEEEDYGEEEAPVGAQEILSLREQLKERIRRKNAVMAAGAGKGSSTVKQQTAPAAKDR
jgi:protein SPT2